MSGDTGYSVEEILFVNPDHQAQLETFVGPIVQMLLTDRATTEQYFKDPCPMTRFAALMLLLYHWGMTNDNATDCEHLAISDDDNTVRATAITCLSEYHSTSCDRIRICRLLVSVLRDEQSDERVKRAAYGGLYALYRFPIHSWPDFVELRFPENIDWVFVDGLLTRT